MAVFRVEKTKDYTVMSNHHLRNASLSLKAKGLLSLMLSLPDNWDYTLHGLSFISADGLSSIRATVAELESAGYLRRRRLRNDKGQLTETEYTILEQPELPATHTVPPICENPILDNPTLGKPMLGNRTQSNTNVSKKDESINELSSIYQSIPPAASSKCGRQQETPQTDSIYAITAYKDIIHENIDYAILLERHDSERLDELVQLILDAVCSRSKTIRIERADYPAEIVKSRLLKLKSVHIEYVLECLSNATTQIRNIKNYTLTALYNSAATIEGYYQAAVNHDYHSDNNDY